LVILSFREDAVVGDGRIDSRHIAEIESWHQAATLRERAAGERYRSRFGLVCLVTGELTNSRRAPSWFVTSVETISSP